MANVNDWEVADADNNAAPPDGWPENTMTLRDLNNAGRQVQGAVRRLFGDINGSLVGGGAVNAYTVTLNAAYTAYFDGMYFACSIPIENTGAATLAVNGLAAQPIQFNGEALRGRELALGGVYYFHYDGTAFQVVNLGGALNLAELAAATSETVEPGDLILVERAADGEQRKLARRDAGFRVQTNASGAITLGLDDANRLLRVTGTGAVVGLPEDGTVPIPVGSVCPILNDSTGDITIDPQGAVLVSSVFARNSTVSRGVPLGGLVFAIKYDTGNWQLVGDLA